MQRVARASQAHPILTIFLIIMFFNLLHTYFNIRYNSLLIHDWYMTPRQRVVFATVAIPFYNGLAYPACLGTLFWLLMPLKRVHQRALRNEQLTDVELAAVQKLLVDYPFYFLCVNGLGWVGGAISFPLIVCVLGGGDNALSIWVQFLCSFLVGGLVTVMQIFFVLEVFFIRILYPVYFREARPADVQGVVPRISFQTRLIMLFMGVGVMPLVALLLLALNFAADIDRSQELVPEKIIFACGVFAVGLGSALFIFYLMGSDLFRWVRAHQAATDELARGNLKIRVGEKRPDEWGRLTDQFNDMAQALQDADYMRQTFGQVVHPDVRDAIIDLYLGRIGGDVCEITVVFADIRGFTRRSEGQPPEKVFRLLNRFLSLAVQAIEMQGGIVNKFLGDGIMALFNPPFKPLARHADYAVLAGLKMVKLLKEFNDELITEGEAPLVIGIGIHTGPALVGCAGATVVSDQGATETRLDWTALGETVNLGQRMEQFTKTLGGPILISEQTRTHLAPDAPLRCLGEHHVPGYGRKLTVYSVVSDP